MAFTKIDFTKDWTVVDQESTKYFPTIETSETQVRADIQLLHNETKTAFNNLIDAMKGTTGSSEVGATVTNRTSTNVQGLLSEINTDVVANNTARHTHSNKALLDTYDQTNVNIADAVTKKHNHSNKVTLDSITDIIFASIQSLISIFTGITRVVTTLSALDTDIPTCKAVTDAMSEAGNGDMMKAAYATESSTKVDTALNAEKLGGLVPSDYALQDDLESLEEDVDLKADLVNGVVPSSQLPPLNYIPVPAATPTNGQVLTYSSASSAWVPADVPTPLTDVFYAGTSAPSNTKLLWIDTTATTGGLKYYDSTTSTWKHVPVAYS